MKDLKRIPDFQSEEEERAFWEKNDSSTYMDWGKAEAVRFPNLKKVYKITVSNNAHITFIMTCN